jgi:hypothetical protein
MTHYGEPRSSDVAEPVRLAVEPLIDLGISFDRPAEA